ncbi:hypothetical protein CHS0354_018403 [Potamilus streckersoni]|uniref:ABC transporter domain-containing protein n=1 Tax=Potamilus streckersoni TaxID=2493646 RepID=A0AAE0WA77_9BIVA|nr:hypothetical protein CHS0354_018403 [Potamilus streckersoni]
MGSVVLKNVVKKYGKLEVVHSINAEIEKGEFIVLVGPSGCGKSTVLRMIAGLEDISGGELLINDKRMNDVAPKDRNIAMVFQSYALYPHMNVFENMSFNLRLQKTPKEEITRKVNEAAAILGLSSLLDRKPAELSGGQRQRVAMGRAIVRNPSVFLFDEPLSNLDAKLRIQMRLEIKKLHQRIKSTVIYVTHDQTEAMTPCRPHHHHERRTGRPLDLFNYPANTFVAGFIGSPPMNLTEGKIVSTDNGLGVNLQDKITLPLGSSANNFNLQNGQAVVFGIRPENICLKGSERPGAEVYNAEGLVDVSEPLGNETVVHFNVKGIELVASVKTTQKLEDGETHSISLDMSHVHLFDSRSKLTLRK